MNVGVEATADIESREGLGDVPGSTTAASDVATDPLNSAWRTLLLWLCLLTAVRFGPGSLGRLVMAAMPDTKTAQISQYSFQIDINSAGVDELRTLEGVGPTLAGRIVEYRAEHGLFGAVDELENVPGFGEKRLARLARRLIIATEEGGNADTDQRRLISSGRGDESP